MTTSRTTSQWNANASERQIPLNNRLPTAGDKRKQMQSMNCGKRNRLSIDRRSFTYQVVNVVVPEAQNDNAEIERLLYGGSLMPKNNNEILEKLNNYNKTRLRSHSRKKLEEQKRLQNISQDVIVINDDELPTSSAVASERDKQKMESASSNMNNCSKSNGHRNKSLSIKSQVRILQNVKGYNNTIQKDEPVKNIITIKRIQNNYKLSKIIYQRIVNIGFAKMPKGIVYKCFMINCAFQSYNNVIFRKHVVIFHDSDYEVKLVDSCGICKKGTTIKTLEEELDHMINHHIKDEIFITDTVTSIHKQALLPSTAIEANSINDEIKEIVTIDSEQEIQESSQVTLTLPVKINKTEDDKDSQENMKLKNDKVESIAEQLVEKTIEEQLQILNYDEDSSNKIIERSMKCAICKRTDRFDMIKCNDCDNWIHNTCKQEIEGGKKCPHSKQFNFSDMNDEHKQLSTDDLLEILSPEIQHRFNDGINNDAILKDKDELNMNVDKYDKEPTLTEHDVETTPKSLDTIVSIQLQDILIEKVQPNVEVHKPIAIDEVKSNKKKDSEVNISTNEHENDLNASNKINLNAKQPDPDCKDTLPMHEVFKLIKKIPSKTKFLKFSAMQPWEQTRSNVKSKKACTSMMYKNGLISTFKCLGKMCSYSTSNARFFNKHLTLHSQSKKDSLYDFFLFCSYCSYEAINIDSLIEHIEKLHCANQYQCPFCFYRCIEAQSCSVHVESYHYEKPLIFYECPVKGVKYDVNKLYVRLLENRETYVQPISCSACGKSFFTFKNYTDHMSGHAHEKPFNKEIQDKVCIDMGKLHGLIENNQFGLYHCLFCLFGSDIEDDIQKHFSTAHPCEPVYICKRTSADPRKFNVEKLFDSTKIFHLNKKSKMPIQKVDVDMKTLDNEENWKKIVDDSKPIF